MKTETPYLSWDTCQLAQNRAEFLVEQAKEEGRELSEDDAFRDACADQDLLDWEWEELCASLAELMSRINSEDRWRCEVKNFGWLHLNGYSEFQAEDGRQLLQKVLLNTDCTFKIFDRGDHIVIDNAHHDAPMGGELYIIESAKKWCIKALYETDEESGDALYWSDKDGWVDKDSASVYRDRETKDVATTLTEIGEWEEYEE